jgi:hypothetical protein
VSVGAGAPESVPDTPVGGMGATVADPDPDGTAGPGAETEIEESVPAWA